MQRTTQTKAYYLPDDPQDPIFKKAYLEFARSYGSYCRKVIRIICIFLCFGFYICDEKNRYIEPILDSFLEVYEISKNSGEEDVSFIFHRCFLLMTNDLTHETETTLFYDICCYGIERRPMYYDIPLMDAISILVRGFIDYTREKC